MKIALINDVHIGPESPYKGRIRKLSRFSEAELGRVLAEIKARPDIDAVIQLGDLIQWESPEVNVAGYKKGLDLFKALPQPVYHLMGNHEQRYLSEADLLAWTGRDQLYYRFELPEYSGLALYSRHQSDLAPQIDQDQLTWLRQELSRAQKPVLVFVHHPLDDQSMQGNPWFETIPEEALLENRAEVRAILENSGKVRAVFQAHVHWRHLTIYNGIPYITLQSLVEDIGTEEAPEPARSWAIAEFADNSLILQQFGYTEEVLILPLED